MESYKVLKELGHLIRDVNNLVNQYNRMKEEIERLKREKTALININKDLWKKYEGVKNEQENNRTN